MLMNVWNWSKLILYYAVLTTTATATEEIVHITNALVVDVGG